MNDDTLKVIITDWSTHHSLLASIRFKVFVEEQQVPEAMEIDDQDSHAQHFLVMNNNQQPVATGRLLGNGHIGRMAVLKEFRKQGVGSRLLTNIIDEARRLGINEIFLNAQTGATGFYEKNDFVVQGEEFMDAGIPHIKMTRKL